MKMLIKTKIRKKRQIPANLEKIIFIRHADSVDRVVFARQCRENNVAHNDLNRPLSKKGKAQSKQIADFLAKLHKKSPTSLIICSPAKRTKQTIKPFLKFFKDSYVESESIKPDCGIKGYENAIDGVNGHKNIALIGHQFDLGNFVEYATNAKNNLDFKKGVIVEITKRAGAKELKGGFFITLLITPDYL